MSESLGGLVDRLITLDLKLWFVQDWVHDSANMPSEEFASQSHQEIQGNLQKLAKLNLERNKAMSAIDRCLDEAVRTRAAEVDPRVKLVE